MIIAAAVLCAIIVGSCMKNRDKKETDEPKKLVPLTTSQTGQTKENANDEDIKTTDVVSVYIIGCVKNPGVYNVPASEVLNKVVQMAGGLTEDADREHINLAASLYNGMMVRIPSVNDEDKSFVIREGVNGSNYPGEASVDGKININTADLALLTTLPGIGESSAKKIIDYRNEHGKFQTTEDLMKVPGIKEGKFSAIKDMITV